MPPNGKTKKSSISRMPVGKPKKKSHWVYRPEHFWSHLMIPRCSPNSRVFSSSHLQCIFRQRSQFVNEVTSLTD
jgi:hypothetical protein